MLWMLPRGSRWLRKEDEDFHEQTALEAVILFLQMYGRPRQMTFDRDPLLSLGAAPGEMFLLPCCTGYVRRVTHDEIADTVG